MSTLPSCACTKVLYCTRKSGLRYSVCALVLCAPISKCPSRSEEGSGLRGKCTWDSWSIVLVLTQILQTIQSSRKTLLILKRRPLSYSKLYSIICRSRRRRRNTAIVTMFEYSTCLCGIPEPEASTSRLLISVNTASRMFFSCVLALVTD